MVVVTMNVGVQSRAASLRRALEREYAANQARRAEREGERGSGTRPAASPQDRAGSGYADREPSSSRDRESRERGDRTEGRHSRSRASPDQSVLASRARRILEDIDAMGMEAALREGEKRRR